MRWRERGEIGKREWAKGNWERERKSEKWLQKREKEKKREKERARMYTGEVTHTIQSFLFIKYIEKKKGKI